MWEAIWLALKALFELSGIPGWLRERQEIKEGEYEQQFADVKDSLNQVSNKNKIENDVLSLPSGSANKWLHDENNG